jgi:hypothetical protein
MPLIEIHRNPDRKQLRTFGLAGLVAFSLLAGWAWWRHAIFGIHLGEPAPGVVAAALFLAAAACGVLAFAAPRALKPLFIALSFAGAPIGYAVSFLVMAVLYYGLLTPIGLYFRLIGRDALQRKFEPARSTYWIEREPAPPMERYFRQH